MSLSSGTRIGPYTIDAPLGAGGMGEVYRARDTRLGRDVAVKAIAADSATDPDRLARFEQEARAAAALNHPNILAVFDIGPGSAAHGPLSSRSCSKARRSARALLADGCRCAPRSNWPPRWRGRSRRHTTRASCTVT